MILVALGVSAFDCYMQRVLIQMRLLKAIKHSTFKMSTLEIDIYKNKYSQERSVWL